LKRRTLLLLIEYEDGTFRVYEDAPDVLRAYRAHDDERATLVWRNDADLDSAPLALRGEK
jgi:hypothetical protein